MTAATTKAIVGEIPEGMLPIQIIRDNTEGRTYVKWTDFINEDTGEVDLKAIGKYKKALLVFTGDKKKINNINLQSVFNAQHEQCYGGYDIDDSTGKPVKTLKRFVVTAPTTPIDLTTKKGMDFFCMCLANEFIKGSMNEKIDYRFRLVIPEIESQVEVQKIELTSDAILQLRKMDEKALDDLATVLNMSNFRELGLSGKKGAMLKIANENPRLLLDVMGSAANEMTVLYHELKRAKVVRDVQGITRFADLEMGTTIDQCVRWMNENENYVEMMKDHLSNKSQPGKTAKAK